VPRLRTRGAIPPLPYTSSWRGTGKCACTEKQETGRRRRRAKEREGFYSGKAEKEGKKKKKKKKKKTRKEEKEAKKIRRIGLLRKIRGGGGGIH